MAHKTLTCPWWLCPTFDNPLRRMIQEPARILAGLVQPGMTAMDLGCGMGYFTLELARRVGPSGMVYAADLQTQMLAAAGRRLERRGLLERVQLVQSTPERLNVLAPVVFALAFWMVHEVRDPAGFFRQVAALLKPEAQLLMVEPVGHVTARSFARELEIARLTGLVPVASRKVAFSRAVLLKQDH